LGKEDFCLGQRGFLPWAKGLQSQGKEDFCLGQRGLLPWAKILFGLGKPPQGPGGQPGRLASAARRVDKGLAGIAAAGRRSGGCAGDGRGTARRALGKGCQDGGIIAQVGPAVHGFGHRAAATSGLAGPGPHAVKRLPGRSARWKAQHIPFRPGRLRPAARLKARTGGAVGRVRAARRSEEPVVDRWGSGWRRAYEAENFSR
jgi:hypothetical protein